MRASAGVARRIAVAAAVASALVLTGCATGQIAETDQEQATLDGVHGKIGDITLVVYLRAPNAAPCFLPGSTVPVSLLLANAGRQSDTLESISSPRFSDSTVAASGDDASKIMSAESGSGSCGGTAAPVSAPPSGSGSLPQPTTIPTLTPHSNTQLGITDVGGSQDLGENPVILLQGLKGGPLWPGNSVQLTLTFARAGKLTLTVPVQLSIVPPNSTVPAPATSGA